jgi:ABC-type sulfate/molybdate transport systems ATPase subunit
MDIAIENLRARRDTRDVLSVPALSFRSGRTTAVLGPNGAGKTTLLRLIAGVERPADGRVLVGGEAADAQRRCVSYLFQENVFLRRSLLENVALGLTIRGASVADAAGEAGAWLRRLEIEALAQRRADRISGGEARRASLACALSLRAPVLLLDEPLAGLDGRTYAWLLHELPGLVTDSRATTLLVTHEPGEAFRLCDDVVVLIGGTVRASGPKHEIGRQPRFAEVAEVLGYHVVTLAGRRVAIPESGLSLSAGPTALAATVEAVVDAVHEWEVAVALHGTRAHVRVPRHQAPPRAGGSVWLAARAMYDVS